MATFKLRIKRGQRAQDVAVVAGSAITGNDGIEVNFDVTTMPKGEALILLDEIRKQIIEHGFPQAAA
ncbi:MAG TPA: hypothetical protein VGW34_09995 [Allosphingosinicella sp.]|nr:hypothetical protein [Allosphingosinicella sp.]